MAAKRLLKWGGVLGLVALAVFLYQSRQKADTDTQAATGSGASKEANGSQGSGSGGGKKGGRGGRFQGPIPVRVVAAQLGEMDRTIEALGTVTPVSTVTVRVHSGVEGTLQRIAFQEGQKVKAGDVLAEIDPSLLAIQVRQAEGTVQKDQATLNNAKADFIRYQTLAAQDSGSKQQRDTQAALVSQLEGTLKIDRAQLDNARLQLSYARIKAPISGRIGLRQLDVGNLVRSSDANPLAVITQLSPITVVFSIPQDRLPLIVPAMEKHEALEVKAYDRDASALRATGTLMAVDNQVDVTTGTVKLKARFDNVDNALFPNQFVNIGLRVEHLKGLIVLPMAAVQHGTPGAFVYVVNADQTVSIRVVTEGLTQAGQVAITKGLAVGESVVIEGIDNLREGAKVNVITPSAARGDKSGKERQHGSGEGRKNGGHRRKPEAE